MNEIFVKNVFLELTTNNKSDLHECWKIEYDYNSFVVVFPHFYIFHRILQIFIVFLNIVFPSEEKIYHKISCCIQSPLRVSTYVYWIP